MPLQPRMPEAVVVPHPEAPASAVFYLHGFASSAQSTKAGYFARQLEPFGRDVPVSGLQRAGLHVAHDDANASSSSSMS